MDLWISVVILTTLLHIHIIYHPSWSKPKENVKDWYHNKCRKRENFVQVSCLFIFLSRVFTTEQKIKGFGETMRWGMRFENHGNGNCILRSGREGREMAGVFWSWGAGRERVSASYVMPICGNISLEAVVWASAEWPVRRVCHIVKRAATPYRIINPYELYINGL